MSKIPVVFLGTPEFACESLRQLSESDNFEIVGVVSQPDRKSGRKMKLQASAVKLFALEKGLKIITPENVNAPEVLDEIKSWKAEAAIVVAFGQLMSQKFLDLFPQRVVNVHASLLPRWRGAAPIQRAIMAGDQETGVALQVMVKKLDAGDVIGHRVLTITENMNALELHDQLKVLGGELLNSDFLDYLHGHLQPEPQDESQVTYAHKIEKQEGKIDWSQSAFSLNCQIRGLALGPGCFSTIHGKKLKIHQTEWLKNDELPNGALLGEVIAVDESSFSVACGDKPLKILVVQPESRPRMSVAEYLKGYSICVGDQLGHE